ncbi:MAG: MAF flag10 domain containing protein [Nitrosopumilales archaeon CG15_BIG_FIL_POST_REV_8_21_14_020_37_12]|nr:MAG: MAF flag10 domain containing protein [Nitrosopumilales archaeon CG15_BIG_FIL_POST_REV_8_21_14_020_37_12]
MMISGWNLRYLEILKEFKYDKNQDLESAIILDSILKESNSLKQIQKIISSKTVFVIGAGPSLSSAIPFLKKYKKTTKIVADSALKELVENKIVPDIVVTDLDGDEKTMIKIGKTKTVFVVHAHGDNMARLHLAENFKNCIGTTQAKPFGKIHNFGGFTDGDRAVFLANHFEAKRIVLFGMDFGNKIGKFSHTKDSDRKIKLKKLRKAKSLLQWLAKKPRSELFTTSNPIDGFKKIDYQELDIIIT